MSCSSHSPPLSHTGQSSGWLVSRNSSIDLRACSISANRSGPPCLRRPRACTPSAASASSRLPPGTCGRRPAVSSLRRSRTPALRSRALRAASITSVPGAAWIGLPSMVRFTRSAIVGFFKQLESSRLVSSNEPGATGQLRFKLIAGTSRRRRSSASRPRRPAGRTCAPACSSRLRRSG